MWRHGDHHSESSKKATYHLPPATPAASVAAHAWCPPLLVMPSFLPATKIASGVPSSGDSQWLDQATIEVLEAAGEFLWSEQLAQSLDAFVTNHASMFADATAGGEQRLEWTQAHGDFSEIFEMQLEQFIAGQVFSAEEFSQACQDALDHGDDWADGHTSASMVECVLASASYEHFIGLMAGAAMEAAATHPGQGSLAAERAEQARLNYQSMPSDFITSIIESGGDVNEADPEDGTTPLHLAASIDDRCLVEALVAAKATLDTHNAEGMSPFHEAVICGSADALVALLQAGADWRQVTGGGETAAELTTAGSKVGVILAEWANRHGEEPVPEPESSQDAAE